MSLKNVFMLWDKRDTKILYLDTSVIQTTHVNSLCLTLNIVVWQKWPDKDVNILTLDVVALLKWLIVHSSLRSVTPGATLESFQAVIEPKEIHISIAEIDVARKHYHINYDLCGPHVENVWSFRLGLDVVLNYFWCPVWPL